MGLRDLTYAAGTAAGTVTVPPGVYLQRVSVLPAGAGATLAICGGGAITIPNNAGFDENMNTRAESGDIVIGGTISSYYVSWSARPNITQ